MRERTEYVAMAATAMADWARRHEPIRLTPQVFREMAGAALDATTLLATRSVPTQPSTGTGDGGITLACADESPFRVPSPGACTCHEAAGSFGCEAHGAA